MKVLQESARRNWILPLLLGLMTLAPGVPTLAQPQSCDPDDETPPVLTEPVELCGVTTLTGRTAGAVRVRLTTKVILRGQFTGEAPAIEIDGQGPVSGFVLTKDVPGRDGLMVMAARMPKEEAPFEPGTTPRDPANPYVFLGLSPDLPMLLDEVVLPPGDYALYLLAADERVRVTIRFSELAGRVDLVTTSDSDFVAESPWPTVKIEDLFYTGTSAHSFAGPGLAFGALWALDQPAAAGARITKLCLYQGDPPAVERYGPACEEADAGWTGTSVGVGGKEELLIAMVLPAAQYSVQAHFSQLGLYGSPGATAAWLALD